MTDPLPPSAPKKKTNWWLIGCGGCLGLVILGIIGFGAIFYGVVKVIKSTEPYKTAMAAATNSPEVQEELGTPITAGLLPTGNVNSNSSNGTTTETADLTIPLKGPKASGSLHYAAKKTGAGWEVSDFTVTVEGSNKKISLGPVELPRVSQMRHRHRRDSRQPYLSYENASLDICIHSDGRQHDRSCGGQSGGRRRWRKG